MTKEVEAQEAVDTAKGKYAAALAKGGTAEQLEDSQIKRLTDDVNSAVRAFKKAVRYREKTQYQSRLPMCQTANNKPSRLHTGVMGLRFCTEIRT
jgi:hypothetical protein